VKIDKEDLTVASILAKLECDPKSKIFTWKHSSRRVKAGDAAGWVQEGYVRIKLYRAIYPAHHLVWFLYEGIRPKEELDHRNGIRSDNRLTNLRECSDLEQPQNQKKRCTNKSGHPNVSWHKYVQKWYVQLLKQGRLYWRYSDSFDDACADAKAAKSKLHTLNPRYRELYELSKETK
jgi:hypothetical protein